MSQANCKPHTALLVAVTMMSVIGLVASDVFLPALPTIIQRYRVTPSQGQSMLGCFLFGIAAMQLVYGPVSDSIGRRRLLIAGITLFALASLAVPHARDFTQVIVLRVLQAIGACAGITLGRAIIGDLYAKEEAGRVFLTIFPVVGMSPAIAPLIGGQLSNHWGWESCFLFSAAFGAVLIALILARVPETRTPERRRPLAVGQIAGAYGTLLGARRFWHYALIPCVAYAAYFAYIAESPFLLAAQGVAHELVGYSYISLSVTYVSGNLLARRLMRRGRTTDQLLDLGYRIFAAGGVAVFLATALAPQSFAASIAAVSLLTLGNGFLLPLGTSGAVTCVPALAGSASGLMGALQISAAAVAAQCIGPLSMHQPGRFGVVMALVAVGGFAVFRCQGGAGRSRAVEPIKCGT